MSESNTTNGIEPRFERRQDIYCAAFSAFGVVVIAAAGITVVYKAGHTSPEAVYENGFTDDGKCLDQTPYDPSEGAMVNLNHSNKADADILSVVPLQANFLTPAVLFFTVDGGQINFADYRTGGLLVDRQCIDANSGS